VTTVRILHVMISTCLWH